MIYLCDTTRKLHVCRLLQPKPLCSFFKSTDPRLIRADPLYHVRMHTKSGSVRPRALVEAFWPAIYHHGTQVGGPQSRDAPARASADPADSRRI